MSDANGQAEKDIPVATELVQLLMELGYVAVGRGLQLQAQAIFDGLAAARPNSEIPLIGLAVCKINFGDFLGASKILAEQALRINPDSGMAKCFLAMAIKEIGGKREAEELIGQVIETCEEPAAKKLAESLRAGKDVP
ncbi:MAG: hypothetical protein LBT64_03980 [Puniceicoccales bacterium]|nr:hypothetical protein [Puniceicoccales bacterium]